MSSKILSWSDFKNYAAIVGDNTHIAFTENEFVVLVWFHYKGVLIETEVSKSDATSLAEFNSLLRSKSNSKEADRVRIVTCKIGRKLNSRFISFSTANPATFDNTDSNGVDFGDVTYWLRNAAGALTTDPAQAVATVVDFMPSYDYEIAGGLIFIPSVLSGDEDDWEIHAVGAPDFAIYGLHVNFVANNRIKWLKGQYLPVDASLNPAEITGAQSPLARKIRFIMLHPAGAEAEFQINIKVFK